MVVREGCAGPVQVTRCLQFHTNLSRGGNQSIFQDQLIISSFSGRHHNRLRGTGQGRRKSVYCLFTKKKMR